MISLLASAAVLAASTNAAAPRVQIHVTSPQAASAKANEPLRATQILDIQFDAELTHRLAGPHLLEFKVHTPKGGLYRVLTVPFHGQAGKPAGASRHRIGARMPVAGTWIVSSSLYGRWTVDAHVDGRPTASARATFTIAP